MIETLFICLREGLEAFLVVAVTLVTLRKMALRGLVGSVFAGLGLAMVFSLGLGVWLAGVGAISPVWEGVLALIALAAVLTCLAHMRHAATQAVRQITEKLELVSERSPTQAWIMIFMFIFFMVSREGVETATTIASLAANRELQSMAWGGVVGVSLAAAISLLWVRYGKAVQLSTFFEVTRWFMIVFAIQLTIFAVHEFSEAGALPLVDNETVHLMTEDLATGWIAQAVGLTIALLPIGWLMVKSLRKKPEPQLVL